MFTPFRRFLAGFAIVASLFVSAGALANPTLEQVRALPGASLLVHDRDHDLIAVRAETPRVPASTLKVLTALAALETWGRDYRFVTECFLDGDGWLWVRGQADPYLVSEELEQLAQAVRKALGTRTSIAGIGLDDRFFDASIEVAGRSASDNPYDAPVTALAANFNTVHVARVGEQIRSAEPQTPLTATARRLGASRLPGTGSGSQRINLRERELALRHFGEVLAAKLADAGVTVGPELRLDSRPRDARVLVRYRNSRTLDAMLAPMLEYSNNFIANALFFALASPDGQGPVSVASARAAMRTYVQQRFGWRDLPLDEGAGLSRGNRLSARQLVQVLEAFAPYRELMPEQRGNPAVRAKTGTLRGVSSYAGYVRRDGRWVPFALLIEAPVDASLRLRLASSLVQ